MFKDKAIRRTILISLVSSTIFLALLKPILLLFWELLRDLSSIMYLSFVDSLYSSAALGHRNWLDFIIFTFILLGALMSIFITSFTRRLLAIRRSKLNSNIITNDSLTHTPNPKRKFLSRLNKILDKLDIPLGIIMIIAFMTLIINAYADLQLNTSFNQRLTVLAPYLTEQEEEVFAAKWASMKCRYDFDKINAEMDVLAQKNNITLPKNLLK